MRGVQKQNYTTISSLFIRAFEKEFKIKNLLICYQQI